MLEPLRAASQHDTARHERVGARGAEAENRANYVEAKRNSTAALGRSASSAGRENAMLAGGAGWPVVVREFRK